VVKSKLTFDARLASSDESRHRRGRSQSPTSHVTSKRRQQRRRKHNWRHHTLEKHTVHLLSSFSLFLAHRTNTKNMSLPRLLPRFLSFRSFTPRINTPLLPLTGRPSTRLAHRELPRIPRISSTRLFHTSPTRRLSPTSPTFANSPSQEPLPPNATLSQRLKHLVRAYGWYAIGVYAVVSIADFAVSFAAVNFLGAEYVSSVATAAKTWVLSLVSSSLPIDPTTIPIPSDASASQTAEKAAAGGREGLYAMLVLAYTLHKTIFLPVRIGVTAVFTPRIVGWLRARGWAGSRGTRHAIQEMRERVRRQD
jgi:N-terminal acetyltransferase 2